MGSGRRSLGVAAPWWPLPSGAGHCLATFHGIMCKKQDFLMQTHRP